MKIRFRLACYLGRGRDVVCVRMEGSFRGWGGAGKGRVRILGRNYDKCFNIFILIFL